MSATDWTAGAAWMKGRVMPIAEASLPVTDWGLTHSDITYDVVHAWDGRFFRLDDYLSRFERSLDKCHLSIEQSREDIRSILHQIVSRAKLQRAYVSFVASRGQPSVPGSRDPRDCINHFYAWCVPFIWVFSEPVIQRGAHLYVPEGLHRIGESSVDPTAKNYHWGDFTQGLIMAKDSGYDNTLLTDANGYVTEGPGFNLFIVKGNRVITPKSGVLEGITRKVAIELCHHEEIAVVEEDISLQSLMEADEVFATTTGGGIIPVSRINQRIFSNDGAGEISRILQERYWQWHSDPSMSEAINYDG
ncbi:branched-chain amino acid--2-keto-4-methylthiobutyrate aminotransferase [Chromatiales bacterium (ex Bugula neritina AB1)]|nr:branched-chain amino acid--2-keto-4-methylthiobutyrate aminotransferase [Chromatiales bacterium (ex Bugula neritina AB1)]